MAQRFIGDWWLEIGKDGRVHRYQLRQQQASSDKLGPCEICGKAVSDVYSQAKERLFSTGDGKEHWAHYGSAYGHQECLIKIRRKN